MTDMTALLQADRPEFGGVTPPICHRLFAIDQAADFAGVPVSRICHWLSIGRLGAYRLGGRVRIDEIELADCLSAPDSMRPEPRGQRTDRTLVRNH